MNNENTQNSIRENEQNSDSEYYKNNILIKKEIINNRMFYGYNKYNIYNFFTYKFIKNEIKNYRKKNINKKIYNCILYRKKKKRYEFRSFLFGQYSL